MLYGKTQRFFFIQQKSSPKTSIRTVEMYCGTVKNKSDVLNQLNQWKENYSEWMKTKVVPFFSLLLNLGVFFNYLKQLKIFLIMKMALSHVED